MRSQIGCFHGHVLAIRHAPKHGTNKVIPWHQWCQQQIVSFLLTNWHTQNMILAHWTCNLYKIWEEKILISMHNMICETLIIKKCGCNWEYRFVSVFIFEEFFFCNQHLFFQNIFFWICCKKDFKTITAPKKNYYNISIHEKK